MEEGTGRRRSPWVGVLAIAMQQATVQAAGERLGSGAGRLWLREETVDVFRNEMHRS